MNLPTTSTVRVSGVDARDFLQGQLSNDLRRLDSEPELLSAWCTPKGRVISVFTVTRDDAAYGLRIPTELADEFVARLTLFRFRAKVEFGIGGIPSEFDALAAVQAGMPWIGRAQSEKFTPHMLNLDLLDGISLDKGCYTGQEIVARTHYKGATKRRTLKFESGKAVAVGDKVSLHGRDIGEVLNVAGKHLLAVVPVAKAGSALSVNGSELSHRPLSYMPAGPSVPTL